MQFSFKLQDVTRDVLQDFFDEKAKYGRKDGKGGLSPSSLRQYKNIILQTLNEASSSHRSFPLSREAKEIFLHAKAEEKINRQLCGAEYEENDFIFKWPNGKPFSPDYVSSHFSLALKNNHLPHIRFHELRHSCASLLLNNGFTLKDVQEYMGHSDIQMTANIYGHLDTQRKQMLTDKVAACLF